MGCYQKLFVLGIMTFVVFGIKLIVSDQKKMSLKTYTTMGCHNYYYGRKSTEDSGELGLTFVCSFPKK